VNFYSSMMISALPSREALLLLNSQ